MTEALLLSERKAYGAFYTPADAAHYMASWAIRSPEDVVLEPSLGDGSFIAAANDVAAARGWRRPAFVASELNPRAAADVVQRGLVTADELAVGDFLQAPVRPVHAAIGNPPYVRLRALPEEQVVSALGAARADMGETMQSSGSVWMPFVSRAAQFLCTDGRMALVLPWDMTYVRYARPLWRYLAATFGSLRVVRVRERLFPDLGQDVLLLFADHKGRRTDSVLFEAHRKVEDLIAGKPEATSTVPVSRVIAGERVFQEALLPSAVREFLVGSAEWTVPVRDLATFNIGYVTGDKDYFHPGPERSLPESSLRPAITNARRIRGGGLYTSALGGSATSKLWLPGEELSEPEKRYERYGRRLGVHRAYKCKVREPWYRVPGVKVPDLVLSVFSSLPVLMVNDGGYVATNSLLCGYLRQGDAASFAASWYTSLTLLHAELEVHSLGGGVLVLVPNEAGSVRVPKPHTVSSRYLPRVEEALRAGDLRKAYEVGDVALAEKYGAEAVGLMREGIATLASWRLGRPVVT
ncbi:hypothetical protein ACFP6A_05420 [Quadrisphaera sp. GCM10027208]|uniref:hypothetical protein n=1 Tax=Quadrisphaera sp. GCM10027208 TaxID=3273423 RepID=UPI003605EF17